MNIRCLRLFLTPGYYCIRDITEKKHKDFDHLKMPDKKESGHRKEKNESYENREK